MAMILSLSDPPVRRNSTLVTPTTSDAPASSNTLDPDSIEDPLPEEGTVMYVVTELSTLIGNRCPRCTKHCPQRQ